uniref:Uncharacterized protein n=1 Tax=Odontella aurita TaxID=265563 RepID=A0A7S4NBN6_9STRA|mmetsp:Transcript_56339/g.168664  ORF Transcript_56339/g.168664 Transcript_56339/m.168664 type:complete len:361 (+) Transcript_56339:30-1112(+)
MDTPEAAETSLGEQGQAPDTTSQSRPRSSSIDQSASCHEPSTVQVEGGHTNGIGRVRSSDESGIVMGVEDHRRNPRRSVRRSCTMDMVNTRIFPDGTNPLGHCIAVPADPSARGGGGPSARPLPRASAMTVKTQRESVDKTNAKVLRMAARIRRRRRSSCGGGCRASAGSIPSVGNENSGDWGCAPEDAMNEEESMSVGFTSVDIREYPVRCGDSPFCSSGPPLTISWESRESFSYPLDTYETSQSSGRARDKREMIIPPDERMRMLRDEGHSFQEVYRCAREAEVTREKVFQSMCQSQMADKLVEGMERSKRALGNVFRKKKKEEERRMIKKFLEESKKAEEVQSRALEESRVRDCPAA